MSWLENLKFH